MLVWSIHFDGRADVTAGTVSFEVVAVAKPDDANVIVGQAHFIKTVDDLHEALVGVSAQLRFGVAFCEASGARLVRASGNDDELVGIATANAQAIGAGHSFVVLLRNGFPVNVLNPIKAVPEVCMIYCATANPLDVVVVQTDSGRGIVGVIDGSPPVGIESADDVTARRALLRDIGYKL
jgi:adenosine/AMP kinase